MVSFLLASVLLYFFNDELGQNKTILKLMPKRNTVQKSKGDCVALLLAFLAAVTPGHHSPPHP